MLFSMSFYHFLPLMSRYAPKDIVLKHNYCFSLTYAVCDLVSRIFASVNRKTKVCCLLG
jgi:hypothetical protein